MSSDSGTGRAPAALIDGKAISKTIESEVRDASATIFESQGVRPGLATVLVGSRPDSALYVRLKQRAAKRAGLRSEDVKLPETVTQEALVAAVRRLAADSKVHGILVQLPLPKHIEEARILEEIPVEKDVDGLRAENIGKLCMRGGPQPLSTPCTPAGCVQLLLRSGVELKGREAVVIGRSNLVGMPVAAMLQRLDCTVTTCHSHTRGLEAHVRRADILVVAVGRAGVVKGSWVKPGAVVIDVGINELKDPSRKRGYRLVGDVEFDEARARASLITPVPGGVGPMTIAMLLWNTVNLARYALGLPLQCVYECTTAKTNIAPIGGDIKKTRKKE